MSPLRAYAFAFLAFSVAMLLRLGIDPWLGRSVPSLLFFPAIMVAARYGGFGPGLFVTALSAAVAVFRYLEPLNHFAIGQPSDLLALALFGAIGALIAGLSDTVRLAEADQWQLAALVESSDDAIVGKDLNGVITSWNRGAERLFGDPAAEAIGRSIMLIIPPERRSEEDGVLRQIRAGKRVEHLETSRRRKDGTDVEVSITVSPIIDGSGMVIGASKIVRDITDRRRVDRVRASSSNGSGWPARTRCRRANAWLFCPASASCWRRRSTTKQTLDRAVHLALPRLGDYCNALVQDDQGQLRHVAWGHVDRSKEPLLREFARRLDLLLETMSQMAPDVPADLAEMGRQIQPDAYVGVPMFVRGRPATPPRWRDAPPRRRRGDVVRKMVQVDVRAPQPVPIVGDRPACSRWCGV